MDTKLEQRVHDLEVDVLSLVAQVLGEKEPTFVSKAVLKWVVEEWS